MTITNVYTAEAFGAAPEINVSPQKVTPGVTTTALFVNYKLTLGNAQCSRSNSPRLYWACSPFSVAASAARNTFRPQAVYVDMLPSEVSAGQTADSSEIIVNNGGFIYIWVDAPDMGADASLDVKLVEID